MSCLDSDPWFPRGATLGVTSTSDGTHIAGTQRYFVDTKPDGTVNSNVPVKCIAMRNTSAGTLTAGQVVKAKTTALLSEVDGDADVDSPVVGVVDEYLTTAVAVNDIFWMVVSGPTTADSDGAISQGAFVSIGTSGTAGEIVAKVANKIVGVALAAAANDKVRVLLGMGDYSSRYSAP
jgi:hypothetical protein